MRFVEERAGARRAPPRARRSDASELDSFAAFPPSVAPAAQAVCAGAARPLGVPTCAGAQPARPRRSSPCGALEGINVGFAVPGVLGANDIWTLARGHKKNYIAQPRAVEAAAEKPRSWLHVCLAAIARAAPAAERALRRRRDARCAGTGVRTSWAWRSFCVYQRGRLAVRSSMAEEAGRLYPASRSR